MLEKTAEKLLRYSNRDLRKVGHRGCGDANVAVAAAGVFSIRTGANSGLGREPAEISGMRPSRASFIQTQSWLRLMPLRSATAETVAPGCSASARILSFCSFVQRRRRSTIEMISPIYYCP
jgi:hypothetical protein